MESVDTVCRHLAHSVFAVVTATEQVPTMVAIIAIIAIVAIVAMIAIRRLSKSFAHIYQLDDNLGGSHDRSIG